MKLPLTDKQEDELIDAALASDTDGSLEGLVPQRGTGQRSIIPPGEKGHAPHCLCEYQWIKFIPPNRGGMIPEEETRTACGHFRTDPDCALRMRQIRFDRENATALQGIRDLVSKMDDLDTREDLQHADFRDMRDELGGMVFREWGRIDLYLPEAGDETDA